LTCVLHTSACECLHGFRKAHVVLPVCQTQDFRAALESALRPFHAWAVCVDNRLLVCCHQPFLSCFPLCPLIPMSNLLIFQISHSTWFFFEFSLCFCDYYFVLLDLIFIIGIFFLFHHFLIFFVYHIWSSIF
jgi:hypothetical protein